METVTIMDNKAVTETDRKVMVMAMVVVMTMVVVVVAMVTADVVLVAAEIIKDMVGLSTALTPNAGTTCLGKNVKPQKHVTMLEVQTMQM